MGTQPQMKPFELDISTTNHTLYGPIRWRNSKPSMPYTEARDILSRNLQKILQNVPASKQVIKVSGITCMWARLCIYHLLGGYMLAHVNERDEVFCFGRALRPTRMH